MTKKKSKIDVKRIKKALPYIVTAVVTLVLVFVGSIDKKGAVSSLSLSTIANNDYSVSVDQMSAFYTVANVSDAFNLASTENLASSYVIVRSLYDSGINTVGQIEKPSIPSVSVARGVVSYTVQDGDTMESIAAKYGLSTDQVRWSNGLKTTAISAGDTLYLPSKPGIVYTVKSGDTVESIASKYGSSAAEIVALNDLEISGVSEGMRIVISGGSLPETERPEYVAPVQYVYTYYGGSYNRIMDTSVGTIDYSCTSGGKNALSGVVGNNYYYCGQCTQWAAYKRTDILDYSSFGDAKYWASSARAKGYTVSKIPVAGAIFQYSSGWYGHVGYVEAVNADGSIYISEMNYVNARYTRYGSGIVNYATIPASNAATLNYIYPRGM